MKTFHFSIYGNICEICESLEEKMINFSFYVSEMTEPSLILSKKLTILQACCFTSMSKFKDCNMRHKVLSQLLERKLWLGIWVTCLFHTHTITFIVREREHVLNKKVTLDIKALIKYSGQGNVSLFFKLFLWCLKYCWLLNDFICICSSIQSFNIYLIFYG